MTAGSWILVVTTVEDTVMSLKQTLREKLGGKIPLNKFQLKHNALGFIKDKQTFCDLNMSGDFQELAVVLKNRRR